MVPRDGADPRRQGIGGVGWVIWVEVRATWWSFFFLEEVATRVVTRVVTGVVTVVTRWLLVARWLLKKHGLGDACERELAVAARYSKVGATGDQKQNHPLCHIHKIPAR